MVKQFIIIEGMLTTTFLILVMGAACVDARKKKIPDALVLCIFLTALANLSFSDTAHIPEKVAGAFLVSIPMLITAILSPGSFGGGDIKFMAACGLFLGAEAVFYSFFYALILGGCYSVYLLIYKNKSRKTRIAFGPFLTAGIMIRIIFQHIFQVCKG